MFFQIESWNFQQLWYKISRNLRKHQLIQLYTDIVFILMFSFGFSVWAEILWGFMKSFITQMLKMWVFYLDKQKSFIPEKYMNRFQNQNNQLCLSTQFLGENFCWKAPQKLVDLAGAYCWMRTRLHDFFNWSIVIWEEINSLAYFSNSEKVLFQDLFC